MIRTLALAAVSALALSGAAFAQDAAPAAPAPAAPAAPAMTPEQQAAMTAIQASGQAFGQMVQEMGGRMLAVAQNAALSEADKTSQLDAIQAEYQPRAVAFHGEVENLIRTVAPAAERDAALVEAREILSVPASVRAQVLARAAAPAAPAAAPAG
ncbi:MAG TPA: hypothetical protein VGB49_05985 [Caulobacteraceae bacterium]|jgi:surface antigen